MGAGGVQEGFQQSEELFALLGPQPFQIGCEGVPDLGVQPLGELVTGRCQEDVDDPAVVRVLAPGQESPAFGPVDEAGHRRLVETQVGGQLGHAGTPVAQDAEHPQLGERQIVRRAAGRDTARLAALPALGADETCTLDQLDRAADVDVVLDYVWGEPAARAMVPMLTARADRTAPLTWVQIGSIGGATAPVPSVALRSARLQIVGSGIGSVPARDFIAELPGLAAAVAQGAIDVRARAVPLAEITRAWTAETDDRIVLVP
jgi:hypothetical protein